MHELHDHALTPYASAKLHPCANGVHHSPRPVSSSAHHTLPQWAQKRVNNGQVVDTTTVWLCDNCHVSVHAYIEAVLLGQRPPHIGTALRAIAEVGIAYVRLYNIPPPYPPLLVPAE